jgi:hypothetical protein
MRLLSESSTLSLCSCCSSQITSSRPFWCSTLFQDESGRTSDPISLSNRFGINRLERSCAFKKPLFGVENRRLNRDCPLWQRHLPLRHDPQDWVTLVPYSIQTLEKFWEPIISQQVFCFNGSSIEAQNLGQWALFFLFFFFFGKTSRVRLGLAWSIWISLRTLIVQLH